MMNYEELYFNTVRSVHQHIVWPYSVSFPVQFVPWTTGRSAGAIMEVCLEPDLQFHYSIQSKDVMLYMKSVHEDHVASALLTHMIHTALHETAHHRQILMMLNKGWDIQNLLSYMQAHGTEWKSCMKGLGIKNPKAKTFGFDWVQEFKYPDLLQQIVDDISEDVWEVLDSL